ncbi:MAG: hypothetical protein PQ964_05905, partial [Methanobacteriaceae archaeon]
MNETNRIRYDPLYRAIDETDEMRFVEGKFKYLFDRLKRINNLGIIPEVLEMAKHSKYEHHSGTMYQINSLLGNVNENTIPKKYKLPLRLPAIFLHVGHLPFTYSTERSLLLASNLDDEVKKTVEKRIQKVLKESNFNNEKKKKHLKNLFTLNKEVIPKVYFNGIIYSKSCHLKKLMMSFGGELDIICRIKSLK